MTDDCVLNCKKLEFKLSALMDSDLAWINGKSARQRWCYAEVFKRSIHCVPIKVTPLQIS